MQIFLLLLKKGKLNSFKLYTTRYHLLISIQNFNLIVIILTVLTQKSNQVEVDKASWLLF